VPRIFPSIPKPGMMFKRKEIEELEKKNEKHLQQNRCLVFIAPSASCFLSK
jgi:hypothetical protein